MNRTAERHVTKAKGYLAKGDEWYGRAADEMIAAQKADPTLGYRELAAQFGRTDKWARKIVAWRTSAEYTSAPPFAEPKGAVATRHAKAVLKDAPLEQLETIIDQLPQERQQAIAAAAKDSWMGARQERDDTQRRRSPDEQQEAATAVARADASGRRLTGVFAANQVVVDLEGATAELKEMIEEQTLSAEVMGLIDDAHDAFVKELEFAKALVN